MSKAYESEEGLKKKIQAFVDIIKYSVSLNIKDLRIADLGCCEGYYSIGLSEAGCKNIIGIDARQENIDVANSLNSYNTTRFVVDDVKNFSYKNYGKFDVILAAGILYHLDFKSAIKLLKNCIEASPVLILDTTIGNNLPEKYQELERIRKEYNGILYCGRRYLEPIKKGITSAYSNDESFWFEEKSLITLLKNIGYKYITKVLNPVPVVLPHRNTYIAMV